MPGCHDYLSDHSNTYLTAYCPLCRRCENYAVPDIINKIGDGQIVGLKTTIGNLWECCKVYNLDHDQCRLDVSIGGKLEQPGSILMSNAELKLQKIGAWRVPEHIRLGDLSKRQHLYGACKCGHAGYIKHDELRERFGAEKPLGELKPLMKCKRGRDHQLLFFAIYQEKR